jgi:hypothetical protein
MASTEKTATHTLFVKRNGATHRVPARQFAKLLRELRAGRGQAEMVELIESGYDEFLAIDGQCYCIDGMTIDLLESK